MTIRITFDNPIDFNNHFSKPKDLKKDLTMSFDSTTTSILPHPLLDSTRLALADLLASGILNSLGNEEKLTENISSGTLLVFKEPSFLLPPPEPPDECLNFKSNLVMKNVVLYEAFYQSNVEDVNSFTIIIWIFLPYFTYTKESPLIFSFRSENFVFDSGIVTFHKPVVRIYQKSQENNQKRANTDTRIRRVQKEAKESKPKPEKSNLSQTPANPVNHWYIKLLLDMLSKFVTSNTASTSGTLPSNTVNNPKEDLKGITTRSGVAYKGPTIPITSSPKVMEREIEVTKDTMPLTNNGKHEGRPNPRCSLLSLVMNHLWSRNAPVSDSLPNQNSIISFLQEGKCMKGSREKANDQIVKFYEFRDMSSKLALRMT
ncbi:hypothetical protein Tco_1522598 [Tanacetum coccineum]